MNSSVTKTLLALLLALRELKAPLTTDEQAVLQNVGQQLALDPDDWDYIKEGLIALIEANAALNHLFKLNKAKLEALDGQLPRDLLPSLAELEQELFTETREVVTFDGSPKDISNQPNEVISLTSTILITENPDQTVKQQLAGKEQNSKVAEVLQQINAARNQILQSKDDQAKKLLVEIEEKIAKLIKSSMMGQQEPDASLTEAAKQAEEARAAAERAEQGRSRSSTALSGWVVHLRRSLIFLSGVSSAVRAEATLWVVRPLLSLALLFGLSVVVFALCMWRRAQRLVLTRSLIIWGWCFGD